MQLQNINDLIDILIFGCLNNIWFHILSADIHLFKSSLFIDTLDIIRYLYSYPLEKYSSFPSFIILRIHWHSGYHQIPLFRIVVAQIYSWVSAHLSLNPFRNILRPLLSPLYGNVSALKKRKDFWKMSSGRCRQ